MVEGRLSVIIPTLNEAQELPRCLEAIKRQQESRFEVERIVVDGGSKDRTLEIAREAGVERLLETQPGRGRQLAAGAAAATGSVLLFLHADCRLPEGAMRRMEHALGPEPFRGPTCAGAFHVRHEWSTDAGPWVRRFVPLADKRSHHTRFPYGDQAVFLTAEAYERCGGMPDQPLMEDLAFAKRLATLGPLAIVPLEVRTSARRFEHRPIRTVICWRTFPWLYRLGVSPERLMRWYGNARGTRE